MALEEIELNESIEELYRGMIKVYVKPGMVDYISDRHRRDFISGCYDVIAILRRNGVRQSMFENPESLELIDLFHTTIDSKVNFLFWNGMCDGMREAKQTYSDFIKHKLLA